MAARPTPFAADTHETVVIDWHGLRGAIPTRRRLRLHLGSSMLPHVAGTPDTFAHDDDGGATRAAVHVSHCPITWSTRDYSKRPGPQVHVAVLDRDTSSLGDQTGEINRLSPPVQQRIRTDDTQSIPSAMNGGQ